ncbi:MAG: VRR-NUC domain-containing protein [Eubacterium sp.]
MKESAFEKRVGMEVRKLGGVYLKLTGIKGIPDRIVLLPGGKVGFIELKALGEKPRNIQKKWISQLKDLGFVSDWADNFEKAMRLIDDIQTS